jgi:hypothetical protein
MHVTKGGIWAHPSLLGLGRVKAWLLVWSLLLLIWRGIGVSRRIRMALWITIAIQFDVEILSDVLNIIVSDIVVLIVIVVVILYLVDNVGGISIIRYFAEI